MQDVIILRSFQGLVRKAAAKFIINMNCYYTICEVNQLHLSDIEEFVCISFRALDISGGVNIARCNFC